MADFLDLFDWVQGLTVADLPPAPFDFDGWQVRDPAKFLAALQGDARSGSQSPREKYGAVTDDLRRLFQLCS